MSQATSAFEFLSDGDELLRRLRAICARNQLKTVSVGVQIGASAVFAQTDDRGVVREIAPADCLQGPAACLTKTLTASLAAQAVAAGRLTWNTGLVELLDVPMGDRNRLSRITLGHLLDHTHGLDCSLESIPRTQKRFVDVIDLCARLAPRPLSEPGTLYSYGNTGVWLAGAVLERLHGNSYGKLLLRSGLMPFDRAVHGGRICPAVGDTLELSCAQWLSFLLRHLDEPASFASLREHRTSTPGWSPAEQACCLGWKFYGAGWFGHNAIMTHSSAVLRFIPTQRLAVAIIAANDAAFGTLAGLFGPLVPEVANLRAPRFLGPGGGEALTIGAFTGAFSRADSQIEITPSPQGGLAFNLRAGKSQHRATQGRLRPAERDIFFPYSAVVPDLTFVQFLRLGSGDTVDYLWNGKQLWRRL